MTHATPSHLRTWRALLCPLGLSLATLAAAQQAEPPHSASTAPTPATASASVAADPAAPIQAEWQLAAPGTERVDFRGLADFDQAGINANAALFVGVGHPAFLAVTAVSFALNAAVINQARDSQKSKVQQEADKVLLPYEAILADYRSSALFTQAFTQSQAVASTPAGGTPWEVHANPVFSMTQDQKAIVLDSVMTVRTAGSVTPAFTSAIRVVGAPQDQADLTAYWTAEQGQALRSTSEGLLAEALRLTLTFANPGTAPSAAPAAKSLRFMQGGTERVERADVLRQDCARTVFRTLRGALMSVPTHRPDSSCAQPVATAAATPAAVISARD